MRIAVGCDEIGFPLKQPLVSALESAGHSVLDLGAFSTEPVDYPDYARVVGQAVVRGFADAGLLVCGSGVGAAIAANKLRGIRAVACADVEAARRSREEQDANLLCLPAPPLDAGGAIEVAQAWVAARFSGEEPHARRLAKISQLEAESTGGPRAAAAPSPALEPQARINRGVAEIGIDRTSPASFEGPAPGVESEGSRPGDARELGVTAQGAPTLLAPRGALDQQVLGLPGVDEAIGALESRHFAKRAWEKDVTLWKGEGEAVRNRLGWLTAPAAMRGHVESLKAFADEIRRLQFSHVLVLGMGAASLSCDLFRLTFRSRMGYPDLLMLDSTDPGAVKHALESVNVGRTLFLVSTKSGTTTETLALYSFFHRAVESVTPRRPGQQFAAITGADGPFDQVANEAGFRRTFLNPPSVGARYSALSFFGLVPGALVGADIRAFVERALAMVERCSDGVAERDNPGVRLGAALAGLARLGRNKVTFILSREIRGLGPWIEQLLAESLGKDGKGLVPVVDEPLGAPDVYGPDRVFVAQVLEGDESHRAALAALSAAGHPVIRLGLRDPLDMGGEVFRWEMATAAAGVILDLNPFDEPDVARAREITDSLLTAWKRTRRLPAAPVACEEDGIALIAPTRTQATSVAKGLAAHLAQAQAGDYLAIQAYLTPNSEVWRHLQKIRVGLRDRLRIATTLAFGPQYLHCTGQLHKGGPAGGLFLQITSDDKEDLAIPGAGYGFGTLRDALASSDLQALRDAGRRVIRLHLIGRQSQGLQQLGQLVETAIGLL